MGNVCMQILGALWAEHLHTRGEPAFCYLDFHWKRLRIFRFIIALNGRYYRDDDNDFRLCGKDSAYTNATYFHTLYGYYMFTYQPVDEFLMLLYDCPVFFYIYI